MEENKKENANYHKWCKHSLLEKWTDFLVKQQLSFFFFLTEHPTIVDTYK